MIVTSLNRMTPIVAVDRSGNSGLYPSIREMCRVVGGSPEGVLRAVRRKVRYRGLKVRAAKPSDMSLREEKLPLSPSTRGARRAVVREDGERYPSVSAAAKACGINKPDNICNAIKRKGKSGGWTWAYAEGKA